MTMKQNQTIAEQGQHARYLAALANARHAAHEARMAVEHMLQDFQVERIRQDLDNPPEETLEAKIRRLERENRALTADLAPDGEKVQEKSAVDATPGKTAETIGDHVAYVYAQYAMKMERYAKANDIKAKKYAEAKPTPEPSRFVLQRDMRGGVGVLVKVERPPCFGCDLPTEHKAMFYGELTPMCSQCQKAHL